MNFQGSCWVCPLRTSPQVVRRPHISTTIDSPSRQSPTSLFFSSLTIQKNTTVLLYNPKNAWEHNLTNLYIKRWYNLLVLAVVPCYSVNSLRNKLQNQVEINFVLLHGDNGHIDSSQITIITSFCLIVDPGSLVTWCSTLTSYNVSKDWSSSISRRQVYKFPALFMK